MVVKYSPSSILDEFGQNPRWLPGIKHSHIVQKVVCKYFHADFIIDRFQILYNG
jgi:hypothetical protein